MQEYPNSMDQHPVSISFVSEKYKVKQNHKMFTLTQVMREPLPWPPCCGQPSSTSNSHSIYRTYSLLQCVLGTVFVS